MSEQNPEAGANENPELPEGTEIVESPGELLRAIAMKGGSPSDVLQIGVGLIDAGYGAMKSVAGPYGEMAAVQALTTALMADDIESGLRTSLFKAAMMAEALEGDESPAEIAAQMAERFTEIEGLTNFEAARDAWREIKAITGEAKEEVDALEAAFNLPDADEPETTDEPEVS